MKKKILSALLLSTAVMIPASAADILLIEKTVDYEKEKIYINVTANGEVDYYNLTVIKPGKGNVNESNADEVLFYAKQQKSGNFILNFPQNFGNEDCGLYNFTIGGNKLSKTETGSFYLTDIDNYNTIEEKLNSITDVGEFAKLLTDNSYIIGIENEDYTTEAWSQPIITVLAMRDESGDFDSFANFAESFNKACKVCEISGSSIDTVEELLLQYMDLFELDMGENSEYAKFNDEQKKSVLGMFLKKAPFATDKTLSKVFEASVFLTRVNNSYESSFADILKTYNGDTTLESYTNLTTLEFSAMFDSVVKLGDFDDIDIFAEEFNTIVRDIINNRSNQGNSNGGSGGGSGGSGGNTGGGAIGSAVPEVPETTQVEPPKVVIFADLEGCSWAEEAICNLAKENIVSGYEDGTFKPYSDIKREEFVKILVDAFDFELVRKIKMQFTDVKEVSWCYPYIEIAYNVGITQGIGDGRFGVGDNITRQDMAVMLHKCLMLRGVTVGTEESKIFADDSAITPYAKESIYALSASGIISGFYDNSVKPLKNASRAEAAQMIYYTIKNVYKEE